MKSIQSVFEEMGAEFLMQPAKISERMETIKAFIFDWDGVFNNGIKEASGGSTFSEIDSMGTNLLRFSWFLVNKKMPLSAVISGERNETAFFFCRREHFHTSYHKVADKRIALQHFCETHQIKPHEVCYFFDDVLDLGIASVAGLRVLIPRKASTLFTGFVKQNQLADYITGNTSGNHAIREACEMLMASAGMFEKTIGLRMNYDEAYKEYVALRNAVPTNFYTLSNGIITASEL